MTIPVLLLSGMNSDERLFGSHLSSLPNVQVVRWLDPFPGESLRSYAVRMAERLELSRSCLVGGASFGGMVAMEMAVHLQAKACILIGSVRSPEELPWWARCLRPVARIGPDCLRRLVRLLVGSVQRWISPGRLRQLRRLTLPEAHFERWAICAALSWRPSPATRQIVVYHIHGQADRTLPIANTNPDEIVPGGGHALTWTHPLEVTQFVQTCIERSIAEEQ